MLEITDDMLPGEFVTMEDLVGDRALHESDVAALLREHLKDDYRWNPGLGWLHWNGCKWAEVTDAEVHAVVNKWIDSMWREAVEFLAKTSEQKPQKKWAAYRAKTRIDNVTTMAQWHLVISIKELDADPDRLYVRNGAVDLATGKLLEAERSDFNTKVAGMKYVPGATDPDFDKVLAAIPADVRDWMQAKFGQAISGHAAPDAIMPVLHGTGANGKTTLVNAIRIAIGDYYLAVAPRALLADPTAHTTELADFLGVRIAVLEELPEKNMSVTRIKTLNGGTVITARKMRMNDMTFEPTHSMFLTTNTYPVVSESDHGTWRRLALVRFPYEFVAKPVHEHQRQGDPGLEQRVKANASESFKQAVLAWLVEGAVKWYANDQVLPEPPARVVADTAKWRADSDDMLRFWNDALEPEEGQNILASELYQVYREWIQAAGQKALSAKNFKSKFEEHQNTRASMVENKKVRLGKNNKLSTMQLTAPEVGSVTAWTSVRFRDDFKELMAGSEPRFDKTMFKSATSFS